MAKFLGMACQHVRSRVTRTNGVLRQAALIEGLQMKDQSRRSDPCALHNVDQLKRPEEQRGYRARTRVGGRSKTDYGTTIFILMP